MEIDNGATGNNVSKTKISDEAEADKTLSRLPIYWVLYYDRDKRCFYHTPAQYGLKATNKNLVEDEKIIAQKEKLNREINNALNAVKDAYNAFVEENPEKTQLAWNLLIYLRHLVKDVAFADEQEMRILLLNKHEDPSVEVLATRADGRVIFSRDYLCILDSEHCVQEVIAGPKVPNFCNQAEQWNRAIKTHYSEAKIKFRQSTAPLA
jgi:hypothetical protein